MAKRNGKKSGKPSKEVIKSEPVGLPSYIPATEASVVQAGLENVRQQDIIVPRIGLMQGQSPLVLDGAAAVGDLINTMTGDVLAKKDEQLQIVSIMHWVNWIEWGSRKTGEGIIEQSDDPAGALAMSAQRREKCMKEDLDGTQREVQRVTEYHNFMILILPLASDSAPEPYLITMGRTNHKKGRLLLNLAMKRAGRPPLQACRFTLGTEIEDNTKNNTKYQVFTIENDGYVSEAEFEITTAMYEQCKDLYTQGKIKYSMEDEPDPEHSEPAGKEAEF